MKSDPRRMVYKIQRGDGRTVSAHRVGYPRTACRPANLKNFLTMARPLNLLCIPATYANGSWMPVYLSAGGLVPQAPRSRWSV
jgi:hypothetical protein